MIPVGVVLKDPLPLYSSDNDMVESAWRVDAGFAWPAVNIAEHDLVGNYNFMDVPPRSCSPQEG